MNINLEETVEKKDRIINNYDLQLKNFNKMIENL